MHRIHLLTFGCQMNKYDSELVLESFRAHGYRESATAEEASVVLVNTCSVRAHAEERVLSRLGVLRALKRERPHLVLGVMGCMAQRMGADLLAHGVDIVCGTREFPRLPELVARVIESGGPVVATSESSESLTQLGERAGDGRHSRHAYVAVMRGCDLHCSYCIVPTVRGRVASRPPGEVLAEVRQMVAEGVREVTLLGQTVNAYGYDRNPRDRRLADLLGELDGLDGLVRIHMVTSHPAYLGAELIEAIATLPKVAKFLPLPAQSGSDSVLRSMRRGYTVGQYRERVARLRESVPQVELSSDWIVGFPGESDGDFERSVEFLREIGFLYSYVFKYSPRPGTRAEDHLVDDVPEQVKRDRNQRLLAVQEEVSHLRMQSLVGREIPVLVQGASAKDPARLGGRSPWGHQVSFARPAVSMNPASDLAGTEVCVRVSGASAYGVRGEIIT